MRHGFTLAKGERLVELAERLSQIEKNTQGNAWSTGMYLEEFNCPYACLIIATAEDRTVVSIESEQRFQIATVTTETFSSSDIILGFCCIRVQFEIAEVRNIVVQPDYQGKGIGTTLLIEAISEAIRAQAKQITLEVRESNLKARSLYRKLDFHEVGKRPRYYTDNSESAIIMTRHPHTTP